MIKLYNSIGNVFFQLEFDEQKNSVYAYWNGFVTIENVKEGAELVAEMLEQTHCPNFINVNTDLTGPWESSNDWIQREWTPRAIKGGLKNFAFVVSPNIFGQLSAMDLNKRLENFDLEMKTFSSLDDAQQWIQSKN
ncbi:MAG: hypothetical protein U0V72_01045 [Cytophagales bacterium]